MRITPEGVALIKSQESLRLTAYVCPAGVLTIGYGHTGPDVYAGETITEEEAEAILARDVGRLEACVADKCPRATDGQFSTMVCLAYNIGEAAFKKSSVARLHNAGKYGDAAQAFALWNKAAGKVLTGLVKRRASESALYLSDLPKDFEQCEPVGEADGEKPLLQSRGIKGQAIAGIGTAATAATQLIPDAPPVPMPVPLPVPAEPVSVLDSGATVLRHVSDNQDLLAQVMPFIHQHWWVFTAIAAVGIIYAVYARGHDRLTGRA